jgi:hypothetical protein
MYQYTEFDKQFVRARAAQYRDQLERNLAGQLGDEEFKPLRLQNGWYIQRYAPMLRIAVPYGEISSAQLRTTSRRPPCCRKRRASRTRWVRYQCRPAFPAAARSARS